LFDPLDNPRRREPLRDPPYNYQILGLDVPSGPCRDLNGDPIPNGGECVDLIDESEIEALVNGTIDERKLLPSVGLAYRPVAGLSLRAAWSRTVARPSFREMGFYVSVEPASDDLIVGNPQLQLSEVESWDARLEYVWGEDGDLFALSGFYKTIEDPIESIVVRNGANFEDSSNALFRTFFNNPNQATLWGIEVEARKNLGFLGREFARYVSVGGNFTWIEAEVKRTEPELARSEVFFGSEEGTALPFPRLEKSRRLFGQPQWIGNVDVSVNHPDWGTRATLAYFAISDVLDAAGSAFVAQDGTIRSFTLDRYVDAFYQLDLILSQRIWRGLTLKLSAKNLTDSKRKVVYDPAQTREKFAERSVKLGRDFKLELSYTFAPFPL
jgi:outer membrane receptor protein involved in Fe transport